MPRFCYRRSAVGQLLLGLALLAAPSPALGLVAPSDVPLGAGRASGYQWKVSARQGRPLLAPCLTIDIQGSEESSESSALYRCSPLKGPPKLTTEVVQRGGRAITILAALLDPRIAHLQISGRGSGVLGITVRKGTRAESGELGLDAFSYAHRAIARVFCPTRIVARNARGRVIYSLPAACGQVGRG